MKVLIDGVQYVPVIKANTNIEAIAKGLIYQFWGDISENENLYDKLDGLYIRVYDDNIGYPIQNVLSDIVRELGKNKR
jgi:hypothetical protein